MATGSKPAALFKRASWLVILFVGEMLTATAMGYFEAEISKAVVLALFVSLIISSGGNSDSRQGGAPRFSSALVHAVGASWSASYALSR
jgi:hypothetical protein